MDLARLLDNDRPLCPFFGRLLMRLPVDTSVALINNDVYVLGGLTVVSGGRTYVSEDAVSLLRSAAGV